MGLNATYVDAISVDPHNREIVASHSRLIGESEHDDPPVLLAIGILLNIRDLLAKGPNAGKKPE